VFENIYHISTDELLGSWLFLVGTLPAIPYSAVYLAKDVSSITYIGMFILSWLAVLGTYFFVLSAYPHDEHMATATSLSRVFVYILGGILILSSLNYRSNIIILFS
jgi:hypothetical protein